MHRKLFDLLKRKRNEMFLIFHSEVLLQHKKTAKSALPTNPVALDT